MKKIIFILLLISNYTFAQKAGDPALEIKLKNTKGQEVSLSSLKGKVVLVDFWASWCGPCRRANKDFVKVYKAYKDKGFEIYSVSLDNDKSNWKNAIKKDKITWIQVNDSGNWDSPTAQQWHIDQLPTTFLVDKKGILRYTDLEGAVLTNVINKLLSEK